MAMGWTFSGFAHFMVMVGLESEIWLGREPQFPKDSTQEKDSRDKWRTGNRRHGFSQIGSRGYKREEDKFPAGPEEKVLPPPLCFLSQIQG